MIIFDEKRSGIYLAKEGDFKISIGLRNKTLKYGVMFRKNIFDRSQFKQSVQDQIVEKIEDWEGGIDVPQGLIDIFKRNHHHPFTGKTCEKIIDRLENNEFTFDYDGPRLTIEEVDTLPEQIKKKALEEPEKALRCEFKRVDQYFLTFSDNTRVYHAIMGKKTHRTYGPTDDGFGKVIGRAMTMFSYQRQNFPEMREIQRLAEKGLFSTK